MAPHQNHRRFSLSLKYFSFLGRRHISDRLLFNTALLAVGIFVLLAIIAANKHFTTTVPISGGTITEGIVGTPRFVNPVLAINRADHDMAALIYSGLMKLDENGDLTNDVAESVTVSDDGLTYDVKIRAGVHFHDGTELTSRDVAYTIGLIQNPELKSPLRGNWDGVQVSVVSDHELNIILPEAYSPFMENLTVGILPRDLWDSLPIEQIPFSQNNAEPIGSGPYKIVDTVRSKSGLITSYKLSAFDNKDRNPNITTLVLNFYQDENDLLKALNNKEINSTAGLTPEQYSEVDQNAYQIIQSPLPRTFAIYFNENKSPALRDASVRKALDTVLDKQELVDKVVYGFGIPTSSPVPSGFIAVESTSSSQQSTSTASTTNAVSTSSSRLDQAAAILSAGGWKKTEAGGWEKVIDKNTITLSIALSTADTPLFDAMAGYIADTWKALGVAVNISQSEQADLIQSTIRPRDFEAVLYGADIGRQIDLYPFWHSSQKNDPGLNIAQYANIDVDALLQKERVSEDQGQRAQNISRAEEIIMDEHPAVFLFVPTFTYVLSKNVTTVPFVKLGSPSDRFANIAAWHIRSNDLWPIFSNNK